jgi:hypothetical protein
MPRQGASAIGCIPFFSNLSFLLAEVLSVIRYGSSREVVELSDGMYEGRHRLP